MWLRKQIFKGVLWASNKFSSRPEKERVFDALATIIRGIENGKESKGTTIPFEAATGRFIIFSDQHKGSGNGADDFLLCEPAYLAALDYYLQNNYHFVALGDCEELWENSLSAVLKKQQASFDRYQKFAAKERFYKVIGNHDLDWKNDPIVMTQIRSIFGTDLPVYDGVLLKTIVNGQPLHLLCTHGHQGDKASDGNWFSKFFVAKVWAPLQSWLRINPNTPAYDTQLKTLHNQLMYEWSVNQQALLLITGHTHQPVFASLTYLERLYRQLLQARADGNESLVKETEAEIRKRKFEYTHISPNYSTMKPTYFNAGCCCYDDGDITGVEISDGCLRLVKWTGKGTAPTRMVLEEEKLETLLNSIR